MTIASGRCSLQTSRLRRWSLQAALGLLILSTSGPAVFARSDVSQSAVAAFRRHDYVAAAAAFLPLAEDGDVRAQTYLGFMYANGRGVAQSYEAAAFWYSRAAARGFPTAQYMLGLMHDKGQGVPQDYVLAYMWLNLAVAAADPKDRPSWTRIRDAIASKLSLVQITRGQRLALDWQAGPLR